MQQPYFRCRCGNTEAWGSMPSPCEVCPDCKTTLVSPGDRPGQGIPHEFTDRWVETINGRECLAVCACCFRSRSNIEEFDYQMR